MSSNDIFLKLPVVKVSGEQSNVEQETVIVEHSVSLYVNDELFCTFSCTPLHIKELVVGHLIGCGRISTKEEIVSFELSEKDHKAKIWLKEKTKAKNFPPLEEPLVVKIQTIYEIMKLNLTETELFIKTGGVHSVALFQQDKEVVIIQDVARHNAVDKVIGYAVLEDIDLRDKMLVISGRISADMLVKAARSGVPIVLSKSAPTSLSIAQADQCGITLVGFIRGERMNVYTHPARIDLDESTFKELVKKKE